VPPISKNNPLYFITSVTHNRLPVFRTGKLKELICQAFSESRNSAGFLIFSYVVMSDHFHIITDSKLNQSETLRYLNGISARRVIGYLKENGFETSLLKLRTETKDRGYKHSLWEHHSNTFEIKTEEVLMQKVNYIHQNPVEEGLCERPKEYRWSSYRFWKRSMLENEPLRVDIEKIEWRQR
jgi:REP element-mobilizing transposase RayT